MKAAGAVLVILAGVAAGFIRMQGPGQRIERLRIFRDFLVDLRTRIAFSSLSLEDLIDGCRDNPFAEILQARPAKTDLMAGLRTAADSFFRFGKDRETAQAFIGEFGRADLQNQVASLSAYIDLLTERHDSLKKAYGEKFKVNMMLYSFIGTAVALVLI